MATEITDYLEKRVNGQIDWHSNKSQVNQKKFKRIRIIQITCAAILPFIAGLNFSIEYTWYHKVLLGTLGVVIALSEGILSLYNYQELWIQYRITSESLEREKYLYINKIGLYSNENNAFEYLVTMIENILSGQNDNWLKTKTNKSN